MKYCRFERNGQARYGMVESVAGRDTVTQMLLAAPEDFPRGDGTQDLTVHEIPMQRIEPLLLDEIKLLPPVRPSKIVCVGRNYLAHVRELNHEVPTVPLIFLKPPSSLIGHGDVIRRPRISQRVDFEGDLALVVGKRCRHLQHGQVVWPYILGWTIVNDVTARDLQEPEKQWTRAKGFDTFCPVGPVVVARDEVDPWTGVGVETRVNGIVKQSGNTEDFLFSVEDIFVWITQAMTLEPGDLIATGTPEGVGPLLAGDVVEVSVSGIGTLRNRVEEEVIPEYEDKSKR